MNEIIEALLQKVLNSTGILFTPLANATKQIVDNKIQLLNMKHKYDLELKTKLLNNPQLNTLDKSILISNINMNTKKFVNQAKTLSIAIENISEDAEPNKIDDDWLFYFMNKAALISDEQLQTIFGKILSEACDDQAICSKTLINTLSLMSAKHAKTFVSVCSFCMSNMLVSVKKKGVTHPVIFLTKDVIGYSKLGITSESLLELDRLGLINVDTNKEFVFNADYMKLRYGSRVIEVKADEKIKMGNVIFTEDGYLLSQIITPHVNNYRNLDFVRHIWKHKGYIASVKRAT